MFINKLTQNRVQTGKLQIFGSLQTTFNFAYKEDNNFSTYYVYFIHSSNIDAKRLPLSASRNSKLSFERFRTVEWIMLSLIMNINGHLWGVVTVNDFVFGFYVFSWQVTVALEVSAHLAAVTAEIKHWLPKMYHSF